MSVQAIQSSRTKRAQLLDSAFRAKLAPSEEAWKKNPSRFDLPEVDTPKPKEKPIVKLEESKKIWKLRKPIGNMTDIELGDYKLKLDKFYDRYGYRSNKTEGIWKILSTREEVIEEMYKREQDKKTAVLHKARQELLTFDSTPEENPYPFSWNGANLEHGKIQPYVKAKNDTSEILKIMSEYGIEKPENLKNEIFEKYVIHHKKPFDTKDEDPYLKVKQVKWRSEEILPQVKNIIESKAGVDGKISTKEILKEFQPDDEKAVIIALKKTQDTEGYKRDGDKILIERVNQIIKPDMAGLLAIDNLGAFTRNKNGTSEALLVNLNNGKAKVNFMDNARICMFEGEIDLSGLPGIKGHNGERIIRLDGGDESALSEPSVGFTNKEGQIVLRKANVKSTKTVYDEDDWLKRNPKKVESKVTREYKVNIHPIYDPKAKAEYETIPHPKFPTSQEFLIKAKDLLELTRPSKKTSKDKYAPRDFTEVIAFYAKNGKTLVVRKASRENDEDRVRHAYKQVETLKSEGNGKALFNSTYLHLMAKAASPDEKIRIAYSPEYPLKAEINNEKVKGTFFLAPRIESE